MVRQNVVSEWICLPVTRGRDGHEFLKLVTENKKSPPISVGCPIGKDQFTKRLMSDENRINDLFKLKNLYDLRDNVCQDGVLRCHWKIQAEVEVSKNVDFVDELSCSDTEIVAPETTSRPQLVLVTLTTTLLKKERSLELSQACWKTIYHFELGRKFPRTKLKNRVKLSAFTGTNYTRLAQYVAC